MFEDVEYPEIPNYLKRFDVCLIPYKLNPANIGTCPNKFVEYCALGKPIVSTSANISGASIPITYDEIDSRILVQVDEIVPLDKAKVARVPSKVLQIMPDGSVKQLR